MNNYSENTQKKLDKTFETYLRSLDQKRMFKPSYERHVKYLEEGRKLPFTKDEFHQAFKAKNFWKDLFDCGSWLEFHNYPKSDITKLYTGNFCKRDKLCPACAVRRAHKQQVKFQEILQSDESLRELDWYYIVLPVVHSKFEFFEDVLTRLEGIRRKLVQSLNNGRKGKSGNIWTKFRGGMSAIEVTHTPNGWNIHMNLIINAPKGTDLELIEHRQVWNGKEKISYSNKEISEWMEKVADGSRIHNISKIDFADQEQINAALVEVLKYSLKFASLSQQELLETFIKTRGKRLFTVFGNMWGKGLKENIDIELGEVLDEEFVTLIYARCGFEYRKIEGMQNEVHEIE